MRYLSSTLARRVNYRLGEIFFRILHLYSTQLPEEAMFLSAGVSFDSLCPRSRRNLYQRNNRLKSSHCNTTAQTAAERQNPSGVESLCSDWAEHYMTTVLFLHLSQQDLRKVLYEADIKHSVKHYLNPLECLAWE